MTGPVFGLLNGEARTVHGRGSLAPRNPEPLAKLVESRVAMNVFQERLHDFGSQRAILVRLVEPLERAVEVA